MRRDRRAVLEAAWTARSQGPAVRVRTLDDADVLGFVATITRRRKVLSALKDLIPFVIPLVSDRDRSTNSAGSQYRGNARRALVVGRSSRAAPRVRRPVPAILLLTVLGLTMRTLLGIMSGTFVYFLQPVMTRSRSRRRSSPRSGSGNRSSDASHTTSAPCLRTSRAGRRSSSCSAG
jgi:hypothetical protein